MFSLLNSYYYFKYCFSVVSDIDRIGKSREIVESLPPLNYAILEYLLSFIHKVGYI